MGSQRSSRATRASARPWWLLPLLVAGCGSSGSLFEPPRCDEESAELFDRVLVRAFEEVITQPDFVALINAALSGAPFDPAGGALTSAQSGSARVR